jgi:hypothetical protein
VDWHRRKVKADWWEYYRLGGTLSGSRFQIALKQSSETLPAKDTPTVFRVAFGLTQP